MTPNEIKALTSRLTGRSTVTLTDEPPEPEKFHGMLTLRWRGANDNPNSFYKWVYSDSTERAIRLATAMVKIGDRPAGCDFIDLTL